jgi:hypothetical protein
LQSSPQKHKRPTNPFGSCGDEKFLESRKSNKHGLSTPPANQQLEKYLVNRQYNQQPGENIRSREPKS